MHMRKTLSIFSAKINEDTNNGSKSRVSLQILHPPVKYSNTPPTYRSLDHAFMYTQIIKDILLTIEFYRNYLSNLYFSLETNNSQEVLLK
jgi:hypothetical protein